MRTFGIAVVLFIIFHIIRVDLFDGTITLASFFGDEVPCQETTVDYIPVKTIEGDTIETLFAMYPDGDISFVERLSIFYSLNPHLQNQDLVGGLSIKLPLTETHLTNCK